MGKSLNETGHIWTTQVHWYRPSDFISSNISEIDINKYIKINEDMTLSNKKSIKNISTASPNTISSDNIHQKPFTIILNN
jgi:hypothetical protein